MNCLPMRKGHCNNHDTLTTTHSLVPVAPSVLVPPSAECTVSVAITDSDPVNAKDGAISDDDSVPSRVHLPDHSIVTEPIFTWGDIHGTEMVPMISAAFDEVVCWKRNTFLVPSGKVGEAFVSKIPHSPDTVDSGA